MNWLELERLDRDLCLDSGHNISQESSHVSGTYAGRPFRLHVVAVQIGDDESGGPEYGSAYRSPQDFDEGLRIVMTLENPHPIGMRLVDHGGSRGPIRQWLQRLQHPGVDQRFAVRFRLDIWPETHAAPCRLALQRRELTEGLLRTRGPVTISLGHKALSLNTPHLFSPSRSIPLVRLAFDLANALEPALLLAA